MNLYSESRGQGRPIVLLHGWGLNGTVWEGLIPSLNRHGRTVSIDLPGFGRSPLGMKDYSLDFLTKLLAAHAPSPSIWLGWSLGGLLAMDAALRFPEQVAALILIAATPRFTSADDWPCGIPLALFRGFERSVMEHPEDALHRFASLLAYGSIKASAIARYMHERMSRFGSSDKRALLGGLRLLATTDLRSEVARIRCPALILLGENDALVPAHAAVPIHALFSKARTEMVPEAAHAPFLSHPEQTLSLVMEFMDEHCLT